MRFDSRRVWRCAPSLGRSILPPVVLLAAAACGRPEVPISRVTGLPAGQVLYDLADRLPDAEARTDRSVLDFTAAELRRGDLLAGWAGPERSTDPATFVWATERVASVVLYVTDRESGWLHFRCWPFVVPGLAQRVTASLNGQVVATVELADGLEAYSLALPPEAVRLGENTVALEFAYVERPQDHDPDSADARPLAAAFDYVALSSEPMPPSPDSRAVRSVAPRREAVTVVQEPGSELRFALTLPPAAALEFAARGGGHAELTLERAEGGEVIVYRGPAADAVDTRWRADLSGFSGEDLEVVLRAPRTEAGDGEVRWDHPRLLGAPGSINVATNVLLLVVDTLRADHLGSYGGSVPTPHLDALAASGVRFERAYTHAPITVPSHSSMFTSLLPREHGVRNNGQVLADEHVTMAELLSRAYRHTAAFVSLGVLRERFGTAQGFDEYGDEFALDWWASAEVMTRQVLAWSDRRGSSPFFLWAHYSDPHEPYAPPDGDYPRVRLAGADGQVEFIADGTTASLPVALPPGTTEVRVEAAGGRPSDTLRLRGARVSHPAVEVTCARGCDEVMQPAGIEYRSRLPAVFALDSASADVLDAELRVRVEEEIGRDESRRRYADEVAYVDRHIGELLEGLRAAGRLDDTVVIFTADHGEMLGDHGDGLGHVDEVYEPVLRVPLIVSWPGRLPAGKAVSQPVALVDLLPTVVELLRLPDGAARTGRSLVPLMVNDIDVGADRPIVAETFEPEARRDRQALVTAEYKLIVTPGDDERALYNLARDPAERVDEGPERPELVEQLTRQLESRLAAATARQTPTVEHELTEEELERLRSLGYVR